MIKSFKHRGLERFYTTGSKAGIQPAHARKLGEILLLLTESKAAEDMNFPGSGFHALLGNLAGHCSVKVNGNWRVTFRFIGSNAEVVDYCDYH